MVASVGVSGAMSSRTLTRRLSRFRLRYLRAHNPKASAYARQEGRKRLRKFEQQCQLVRYLGANMQGESVMTERPFDFQYKVDEFLACKQST
jgi:hypothetical protein